MEDTNTTILTGRLTRNPELRYIPSGTAVCEVGLAVNNREKKNGEWVDDPCFIDVVCWGKQAELVAEYCQKGSKVLVEGRLKLEQWVTDGERKSKHKVSATRIQFLDGRRAQNNEYSQPAQRTETPAVDDGTIPF